MLETFRVVSVANCAGGRCEWVCTTAGFVVDPGDATNARITDLEAVSPDSDGRARGR